MFASPNVFYIIYVIYNILLYNSVPFQLVRCIQTATETKTEIFGFYEMKTETKPKFWQQFG